MKNQGEIPHLNIVLAVSVFVLVGFAAVTAFVLLYSSDATTKGSLIAVWQNFAVIAIGFWLGSSSGGKAKPDDSGKHDTSPEGEP
jgi:hypothetical protein